MSGALFGSQSAGPSAEQIKAEDEAEQRTAKAAARARQDRRLSRRGVDSLTTSPTSTGLNIPGGSQ